MPQLRDQPKKRVLVVGAGAAGMACADSLSAHPDRFDVTVVESQARAAFAQLRSEAETTFLNRITAADRCSAFLLTRRNTARLGSTKVFKGTVFLPAI
jgi:NADH dehydrogenase FAD-containing subunit